MRKEKHYLYFITFYLLLFGLLFKQRTQISRLHVGKKGKTIHLKSRPVNGENLFLFFSASPVSQSFSNREEEAMAMWYEENEENSFEPRQQANESELLLFAFVCATPEQTIILPSTPHFHTQSIEQKHK